MDAVFSPFKNSMLRHFAERFSKGELPKDVWAYLASALMHPFHEKLLEKRVPFADPVLRPVTQGSVLTRPLRL
jgi:hypothetical protein